jgi:hypothetical protein
MTKDEAKKAKTSSVSVHVHEGVKITTPKFSVGDHVKIVNYGNIYWESKKSGMGYHLHFPVIKEDNDTYYVDTNPELVGKLAIVDKRELLQGKFRYGLMLTENNNHMSWFFESQLELNKTKP